MGLITEILSFVRGGGEADTIVGVETAMARLRSERADATAALETGSARRRELLLQDASDKQIAALEKELDGHHLTLEKIELIEGDLIARMQALRSAHRQDQFRRILKRYFEATAAYIDAHRSAARALDAVASIVDEARAGGFEHEMMAHHTAPPKMLHMAQIAIYESEVERIADAAAGRTTPAPVQPERKPYQPSARPSPDTAGAPRRVFLGEAPLNPPLPACAPRVDVAKEGERLMRVFRSGYEAPDGFQCNRGDVIALPSETAAMAVANGAGEFAEQVTA